MKSKQRRGSQKAGWGPWPWILGVGLVSIVGLMAWSSSRAPRAGQPSSIPKDAPGEAFPSEGQNHVQPPERVTYQTDPPTSGAHYGDWTKPGFYDQAQEPGRLVHALEHGNIVAYYDPARTPPETIQYLKTQTGRYKGAWDGFVAVPRPDPEHTVIFTAWTRMLRMKDFDAALADRFIDAFRGRGPENPVR